MARVWFGTSGFSYKEWRPSFYPAELSEKQFLQYYATQLNSVEIDYTFYRMPTAKTIVRILTIIHPGILMIIHPPLG
jgi:uncharacterized protein YecE (DUF72 family)